MCGGGGGGGGGVSSWIPARSHNFHEDNLRNHCYDQAVISYWQKYVHKYCLTQSAFYVNLYRAVIGPSG